MNMIITPFVGELQVLDRESELPTDRHVVSIEGSTGDTSWARCSGLLV